MNRVTVITGGTSGIGRGIVEKGTGKMLTGMI